MFGFLKNLLRKPANPAPGNQEPPPEMAYESPPAAPPVAPAPRSTPNRQNGGRPTPAYQPAPGFQPGGYQNQNGIPQRPGQNGSGKGIEIPLRKILEVLPVELQPRVRNPHVGDASISIPLDKVLSQLS